MLAGQQNVLGVQGGEPKNTHQLPKGQIVKLRPSRSRDLHHTGTTLKENCSLSSIGRLDFHPSVLDPSSRPAAALIHRNLGLWQRCREEQGSTQTRQAATDNGNGLGCLICNINVLSRWRTALRSITPYLGGPLGTIGTGAARVGGCEVFCQPLELPRSDYSTRADADHDNESVSDGISRRAEDLDCQLLSLHKSLHGVCCEWRGGVFIVGFRVRCCRN